MASGFDGDLEIMGSLSDDYYRIVLDILRVTNETRNSFLIADEAFDVLASF